MKTALNYKPLHEYTRNILILMLDFKEHHNHPNGKYHE